MEGDCDDFRFRARSPSVGLVTVPVPDDYHRHRKYDDNQTDEHDDEDGGGHSYLPRTLHPIAISPRIAMSRRSRHAAAINETIVAVSTSPAIGFCSATMPASPNHPDTGSGVGAGVDDAPQAIRAVDISNATIRKIVILHMSVLSL